MSCLDSEIFYHCCLNIYSLCFYLLLQTGINFYPVWKFEISIQDTILIYIYLYDI